MVNDWIFFFFETKIGDEDALKKKCKKKQNSKGNDKKKKEKKNKKVENVSGEIKIK